MSLDLRGQERLQRLQDDLGDTYFQEVPPQQGKDDGDRVSVTLDAAVRFTEVRIDDFAGVRTTSRSFAEAFEQAYAAADGLRAQRSAELSPRRRELEERVESLRRGTFRWRDPWERRRRGLDANGRPVNGSRLRPASASGSSENGYLSVSLPGGRFGAMKVRIDEVWLHSASVRNIEQAMREAIINAGEWAV
ncbi:hypothetical protein ACIRON_24815 [Nocardioides sp. NPDC101246]|uniref:hypothetical protein n=1 Tax=Nocardioides sp. NPDC101246 TaxID=3364336 RepID=UPI003800DA4B